LALIYPVGIIKVLHYLNDLQIQILFFEVKIDIWSKPTLEGKGTNPLERSKGSPSKIMKIQHEWDPVMMLFLFHHARVFSAAWLLGFLPRELLQLP